MEEKEVQDANVDSFDLGTETGKLKFALAEAWSVGQNYQQSFRILPRF